MKVLNSTIAPEGELAMLNVHHIERGLDKGMHLVLYGSAIFKI